MKFCILTRVYVESDGIDDALAQVKDTMACDRREYDIVAVMKADDPSKPAMEVVQFGEGR